MKKILLVLLVIFIFFIVVNFVVAQSVKPAGPGLGWHNDWWNPETKKVQNTPYSPSNP